MGVMNRMLVASLIAAAFLGVSMGLSVTTGGPGLGVSLAPAVPTAYAERITSGATGNSALDDLCRQAADLINDALRPQDEGLQRPV